MEYLELFGRFWPTGQPLFICSGVLSTPLFYINKYLDIFSVSLLDSGMGNWVRISEPVLKTLGYESIRRPLNELPRVISILSWVLVVTGTKWFVGLLGFC